jgi:putative NIF3 family GTP cyclohydrolase 1 type 2
LTVSSNKVGPGWKTTKVDTFVTGKPGDEVKGIVTTYAPTMEVLRKAVAQGRNMIVTRESPYWERPFGQASGVKSMADDPTFQTKRDYITAHNLIVYRLYDNWSGRQPDPQLQALARALGWENYYKPSGGTPWATHNGFFALPPSTLKATAQNVKKTLKIRSLRVVGDPATPITKAALFPGLCYVADLQKLVAEPDVNLFVIGEPFWEVLMSPYFSDLIASGRKTGMLVIGQEIANEPGSGAMAAWLKTFINEVPVEWVPAGEPEFWLPY